MAKAAKADMALESALHAARAVVEDSFLDLLTYSDPRP